jgi:hypothetical protein
VQGQDGVAGVYFSGASPVAASSFFMMEKMKAAERRQMAMRILQMA